MLTEVRPGVFWIHPPDGGEVYVVRTGAGLVLLDTGLHKHREMILAEMRGAGLMPETICLAFASHLHCDHVGSMGWWCSTFGFEVVAHMATAEPIESADLVATGSKIPYAGFDEDFIPCPIAHKVHGGETFPVGETTFRVVHAPGHTPGSIHVAWEDVLFVGDTLFQHGGIGWMDVHWGSNPSDYVETLTRMRDDLGCLVLSGHMEPFVLQEVHLERATELASFYIPLAHGLGAPRAPSGYNSDERTR